MRHLVFALAASSLALSGCGKKQATGNTSAVDQAVSAEDFAANDATAIDAATGSDANMAADVDINLVENTGDAGAATNASRSKTRSTASNSASNESASSPAPTPATQPANESAQTNSD